MTTRDGDDRIAPFLERLSHLNIDDLAMLALPEPDAAARNPLLQRALDAARAARRADEARVAPARARDAIVRAYSFRGYDATWFGLNWGRSIGRAADRARLIVAIEDAALAEVVEDLLPADDVDALREPFEIATSMTGAGPLANPRLGSRAGRVGVVGAVGVAWLVGVGSVVGPIVLAALAGLASLRRRCGKLERQD
ncbi:MAG TPA: hypothetical protein VM427_09505 [Patescibacteria group bacterium]|nr:hypothetical protein [Patescibacteria group bacterium]